MLYIHLKITLMGRSQVDYRCNAKRKVSGSVVSSASFVLTSIQSTCMYKQQRNVQALCQCINVQPAHVLSARVFGESSPPHSPAREKTRTARQNPKGRVCVQANQRMNMGATLSLYQWIEIGSVGRSFQRQR